MRRLAGLVFKILLVVCFLKYIQLQYLSNVTFISDIALPNITEKKSFNSSQLKLIVASIYFRKKKR